MNCSSKHIFMTFLFSFFTGQMPTCFFSNVSIYLYFPAWITRFYSFIKCCNFDRLFSNFCSSFFNTMQLRSNFMEIDYVSLKVWRKIPCSEEQIKLPISCCLEKLKKMYSSVYVINMFPSIKFLMNTLWCWQTMKDNKRLKIIFKTIHLIKIIDKLTRKEMHLSILLDIAIAL